MRRPHEWSGPEGRVNARFREGACGVAGGRGPSGRIPAGTEPLLTGPEALARLQGDELARVLVRGIRQEVRAREEMAMKVAQAERAVPSRAVKVKDAPEPERDRDRGLSR